VPTTWYFDGSGTDRDSPVIVLTGLAAADENWHEFNRRWTETCQELGLRGWHTADELRRLRAAASGNVHEAIKGCLPAEVEPPPSALFA
jgi:hypothetical protein